MTQNAMDSQVTTAARMLVAVLLPSVALGLPVPLSSARVAVVGVPSGATGQAMSKISPAITVLAEGRKLVGSVWIVGGLGARGDQSPWHDG